ncbi:MAG: Txe/YoeB family addiction module toxin [Bacteroidales bacterium]|jgi:toxin YoeB|nr:Txe/YoeB family addiction module toxin [Bacteroidales bacterium]
MTYKLVFTDLAERHIEKLGRVEPQSHKKLLTLLEELVIHPKNGRGHPKPLSGNRAGEWSRRITDRHRLVYEIRDTEVIVLVLSAYGHYHDK